MKLRRLTLAFQGDMERAFLDDYFDSSIRLLRLSFLLGIVYYAGFSALDALALPGILTELTVIRFGVVIPFIFAVVLLSYTKGFRRWWQPAAVIVSVVSGVGIVAMTVISPELGKATYYPGMMLVLFYCYMLIKLRFVWATLAGWIIFSVYLLSLVIVPGVDGEVAAIHLFFIASANVLGMFGGYALEYYTRKEFFLRHLLGRERKKVEEANEYLEDRVREKTQELEADLRRRARMAAELRESEENYRTLVETLNEGIWRVDAEGVTTFVNARMAEMLGYAPQEMVGAHVSEFTDADWVPHPESPEVREDRSGQPGSGQREIEAVRRDGERAHLRFNVSPVVLPDGSVAGALAGVMDVTDQKESEAHQKTLQERLAQAQKMESVGRLAGGVAHDFNNMLSVILGHVDLGLSELSSDAALRPDLEQIRDAAERSADLTRQLLAFARRQPVERRALDLNETIEPMRKMLGRLIGEDVELIWDPAPSVEPIRMDPAQIDQLLANLVVNARDAIDGVGSVTIETHMADVDAEFCASNPDASPGRYVRMTLRDTGCGMDRETLSQIFEPFFTTKPEGKGTGLGLATVYGIVKQNRGFVTVASVPGEGTDFAVYLPVTDVDLAVPSSGGAHPTVHSGSETILLVEDESALLNLLTRLLDKLGYRVLTAADPKQAIRLAEEHSHEIDLLITDVVMPEMNGRDLAGHLGERFPGMECLYMSGYTADVIADQGVLDEDVHFIEKPFNRESMAAKIRSVLG